MGLDRPVFIVGTGRCGSTVFHEIFTRHPEVAFLSGLCTLYPHRPEYNRWAMQFLDVPVIGRYVRRKFRPAEHWSFWDQHCRGFSMPFRDLLASDLRPNEARHIKRILEQMVTANRRRFLAKLTGWPRMGFLAEAFPDAKFIHIIRDGRAVANSLLNTDFWLGYRGTSVWQFGSLSADLFAEWERSGLSFVALAGIYWKIMMRAFEKAKLQLPASRYIEIRYEEFAASPRDIFGEVLAFCEMEYPKQFKDQVSGWEIESANFKWKEHLTAEQQQVLEEVLADDLARYGYANSDQVPTLSRSDAQTLGATSS